MTFCPQGGAAAVTLGEQGKPQVSEVCNKCIQFTRAQPWQGLVPQCYGRGEAFPAWAQRDGKTSSDLSVNVNSACKKMSTTAFSPGLFLPTPRCLLLPRAAAPTEIS